MTSRATEGTMLAVLACVGGLQPTGHAARLRTRGYTVISEPVVSAKQIDYCATLCHSTLEGHLADVEAAGCDPFEQMYRFNSICHRQRNRWDVLIARERSISWAALVDAAMDVATPIIREAQGPAFTDVVPLMSGAVISRPGARVQRFHVDAEHAHFKAAHANPSVRMYNIFIPLVPISEDGDGTQFWPAPVLGESSRALAKHVLGAPDSVLNAGALEAPSTPAGGLVIFDYRTIHRGLANAEVGGRERAVAYVACSSGGAKDVHNFPRTAVGDISLERAKALPRWNTGTVAQDRLDYYTEIEGDDPFGLPRAVVPRAVVPRAVMPRAVVPQAVMPRAVVPRAVMPLTRGHTARHAAQPRAQPCAQPRMLSSFGSTLEVERRVAREMHARTLRKSEATYHCNKAQSAYSDAALPAWDCYSFPGAGSGLGVDDAPPGAFGEDELARVSRGPLLSGPDCASVIAEAEALDAWEVSPRVAHYARRAGCLTPLCALPKSLAMLSPFLTGHLFPAIQKVRAGTPGMRVPHCHMPGTMRAPCVRHMPGTMRAPCVRHTCAPAWHHACAMRAPHAWHHACAMRGPP